MDKPTIIKQLQNARRAAVPLVGISTADQCATVDLIRREVNGGVPLIRHGIVLGAQALNDAGAESLAVMLAEGDPSSTLNPVECLRLAAGLPECSMLVMMNAHRWISEQGISQALHDLRDQFKGNQRMIVLLAPELQLPSELTHDFVLFDEALPDQEQVKGIVSGLIPEDLTVSRETIEAAAEALSGLPAFASEQCAAMAISKAGLSVESCWQRKQKVVEQTPGCKMSAPAVTYKDVGGLSAAREYFSGVFAGPMSPRLLVFMDEVEKLMAGSSAGPGDNTGVSQDFLSVLLDRIERNKWLGALFLGPGGTGKSYFSEAIAGEHGCKLLRLDTGAMKTSALGASEQAIRHAMKTVEAIGADRVLICATCNSLQELRPELQRRLASAGMWFFDLPDQDEKMSIWDVQIAKFGLEKQSWPNCVGWSSSDIRDCCRTAYMMGKSLVEAAVWVNPAMAREPERIESLRKLANGRLLSASYKGAYKYQPKASVPVIGRRLSSLEEL